MGVFRRWGGKRATGRVCCLLKPKHSFVPQFQFGVIFNLGMTLDIMGKGEKDKGGCTLD